jgi:hypothetical protein
VSAVITDADGIDWPPMPDRGKPPPRSGTPFVPEDMRPAWTAADKATCADVLQLGEFAVRCERRLEGRHGSERPDEHHGHLEIPGKTLWATVTWRRVAK